MSDRRRMGNALPAVAALLIILVGAGGFNYYRNFQVEEAEKTTRKFSGQSDENLEQLRAAYQAEADAGAKRYSQAQQGSNISLHDAGSVGANAQQYEDARRVGSRLRDMNADVGQREARLREIKAEQRYRAELGSGWQLHLRRLTKL